MYIHVCRVLTFLQIWQNAPQTLLDRCPNLQTLEIHSLIESLVDFAVRNCALIQQLVIGSLGMPKVQNDNLSLALFRTLEEHGHNIREFEFRQGTIKICQLLEMPTVLGRLTSLTLGKNTGRDSQLVSSVMQTLGSLCSNLRHLDLRQYENLYKDDLEILLFGLRGSLISLKVGDWSCERRDELLIGHSPFDNDNCPLLEKLLVYDGGDAEDVKAICRLSNLKELSFVKEKQFRDDFDLEDEEDESEITDEDFQEAFDQKQLISLQKFAICGHHKFGSKATASLLKNCPKLTLWGCYEVGQIEGLVKVVHDCGPKVIRLKKLYVHMTLKKNEFMVATSLCNLDELHMCCEGMSKQGRVSRESRQLGSHKSDRL
jgi:hypothetical protein